MMATTPTIPDWLVRRDGSIKPGIRDNTLFVIVGGQPQYRLDVRPAAGQYTCVVTQTVNGKQLDDGQAKYPTPSDSFAGGLEQLRARLGW